MADSNPEKQQKTEAEKQEEQKALILLSLPFASFSLTLSTLLPANPLLPRPLKPSAAAGVPTQASSLSAALSLSSSAAKSPSSLSFKSAVSAVPLHSPLSLAPRRPSEPSGGAALRRATVVWFRSDLRVADNECLNSAHSDSASVLPVYVFDPRDYGKSSSSGFDRTGPYRAAFLIDSVTDLRIRLRARGSDLVVRLGRPEEVLRDLAKSVGAEAVYASREVSHDEARAEERVEAAAKDEGVEVKYFWGSTLYHLDDLPFKLEDMPANYGGFREKVKGLSVRQTFEALDHMKALPSRGDVEVGDIPTLSDLGVSPIPPPQDGKPTANGSMVGGETEAMERLKKFAAECQSQAPAKDGKHDSVYGANFSCKISPWLAMGCLSPRTMFDELKKTTARTISASSNKKDGGAGMNWLLFELLWRDFFRFITKKYSSAKKQLDGAPATACTGAFA